MKKVPQYKNMSASPPAAEANVIIKGTDSGGSARGPNSNKSLLTKQLPEGINAMLSLDDDTTFLNTFFGFSLRSHEFPMSGFIRLFHSLSL